MVKNPGRPAACLFFFFIIYIFLQGGKGEGGNFAPVQPNLNRVNALID